MSPSTFPLGMDGLMANREFENIVANRATWMTYVVAEYDDVLVGLEHAHELVRSEIQSR